VFLVLGSTFDRRFAFQVQEMQVLLAGVTGPKAFVMTGNTPGRATVSR
jgi:hypothetical protein